MGKKSAYILFSTAIREKVKEENPKAKFGKIAKITGKKWKELTEEERQVWKDKADKENEKEEN